MIPKITVLLPHFHHRAYLADAVQSIIDQTYQDWELLILDDEPAGSNIKISRYATLDPRIKVFTSAVGVRMKQAFRLNQGIRFAKGKYIAFQDADDLSFPYRFAISVPYLDDGYDLIYGDKVFLYPDKQVYWKSPDWDKTKLHLRPMGCWGSYMVRTDIAEENWFDENVGWGLDHLWEARFAVRDIKVARIPLPLYKQRTYSSMYRTCRIPVYRKIKRLKVKREINRKVKEIIYGHS
ncbi:glycosyltransferase [bacterium]|nr:glycosyltransferase [bacterium]